jgi:hypothetical protein
MSRELNRQAHPRYPVGGRLDIVIQEGDDCGLRVRDSGVIATAAGVGDDSQPGAFD